MPTPTVQVPVSEIEQYVIRGLAYIKQDNIRKWNERVDQEWSECAGKRWFWIGPLKWESRDEIEELLGKPEAGQNGILGTSWNLIRGANRQVIMYRQFLELFEYDPLKVITMSVVDYTTLMSFDNMEVDILDISTVSNYYGHDDKG